MKTYSHDPEAGYAHRRRGGRSSSGRELAGQMFDLFDQVQALAISMVEPLVEPLMQPRGRRKPKDHGCCDPDPCDSTACECKCEVCGADVLVYARCGERRIVPFIFKNDLRREREVTLELSAFKTQDGKPAPLTAKLSATKFTLPPCGELTVMLLFEALCKDPALDTPASDAGAAGRLPLPSVESCLVAYANLRAEGCLACDVRIAVALLPYSCGAYEAKCGCGCCCC